MRHLDLFSGIGGFALAAQTVWGEQYHNVGFCDNEPFSQAIIKKHWPEATIYNDIKTLTVPPPADLVTGGFPCQPFSAAGLRRGTEDDRHLWPEMLRVIRASAPRWVIGENVGGLVTWNGGLVLQNVLTDLEREGYQAWPFVIPAVAVNAPHRRDRVWIVAHARGSDAGGAPDTVQGPQEEERLQKRNDVAQFGLASKARDVAHSDPRRIRRHKRPGAQKGPTPRGSSAGATTDTADPHGRGRGHGRQETAVGASGDDQFGRGRWDQGWLEVATRLCTVDDGLPNGLARPRGWRNAALKGAGNAIVPQVAIEIMRAIRAVDPTL